MPIRPVIQRRSAQRGMIVVLLAAGLTTLLAVAGLALDFGHAYLNKTRLQSLVDTLALAAALRLNETGSTTQAGQEAQQGFSLNMSLGGNAELANRLGFGDVQLTYSDQRYPFIAGGIEPRYVKVSVTSLSLQSWFIRVLGVSAIPVTASAIAGPSASLSSVACDVAPVMVCGDPAFNPETNGGSNYWGYQPGRVQILKATSQNKTDCVGPGNFQLLSTGGQSGGNVIRDQLAGNVAGCGDFSQGILTKPGNTIGPSMQGINTRFGDYSGSMSGLQADYPPDVITTTASFNANTIGSSCIGGLAANLNFSWAGYKAAAANANFNYPPPVGAFERRILRVPIGDCSGDENGGKSTIPFLGVGCFFLLQKADQNGSGILGEFVRDCLGDGPVVSGSSGKKAGPYKIVLYESAA